MQWASLFFALSGAAAVVAGICFLLASRQPDKLDTEGGRLLNSRLQEVLERQRFVERFIYRHHRLFGSAIVAGALVLLALLGAGQARFGTAWLGRSGGRDAVFLVWALAVAALVIGIIVLVRPSALKGVETLANRWIQLFPAIELTSRQIGALFLVLGIVCLVTAARIVGGA